MLFMLVYLGLLEKKNASKKRPNKVNGKIYNLIRIYQIFVSLYFIEFICLKFMILAFKFSLFVFLSPDEVVVPKLTTSGPINFK